MIVADTSAWIDYFNGLIAPHTEILDQQLKTNNIAVSLIRPPTPLLSDKLLWNQG